ncbi:MAG: hypothetical protein QNJ72_14200 [Pleurocapsa sp. MO_226.B13]|nr:hypothetical protein [Pleurocapsa sp. MO_226.B13]
MSVKKFLTLLSDGATHLVTAIASSTGAADKDKIVATGADGKLDLSLMPTGLDVSAEDMEAAEAIAAGEFINIFDDGGTRKVRLADADNNRPAHGFVLENIANAATGKVYTTGVNNQLSGLTPGVKYFLSDTPGDAVNTVAITSGNLIQSLGTAIGDTSLRFEFDEPIYVD